MLQLSTEQRGEGGSPGHGGGEGSLGRKHHEQSMRNKYMEYGVGGPCCARAMTRQAVGAMLRWLSGKAKDYGPKTEMWREWKSQPTLVGGVVHGSETEQCFSWCETLPGNLLEIQILRCCLRSPESDSADGGQWPVFTKLPGDSGTYSSLRMAEVETMGRTRRRSLAGEKMMNLGSNVLSLRCLRGE